MKVLCSSLVAFPTMPDANTKSFVFFDTPNNVNVGRIAHGWPSELRKVGYAPSTAIWDFVLFSFAVCAADYYCHRDRSPDGWTREIELSVTMVAPERWNAQADPIQKMLRILTGDYWKVNFLPDGPPPPNGERQICDRDCVALLSGGLDSLIGGIDLRSQDRHPIFVSQLAYEDSARQRTYAAALDGAQWHQQWSHKVIFEGPKEPSTRARSMAFYGLAVLASSLLDDQSPEIFVPENGFISLNPPLLPGRMASLSTRTTHPLFMAMLQSLLASVGVGARLTMPYKFKTKGEMMSDCLDPALLAQYAADTTSCGRFRTYNRMHCGRCVPCMVRKAAFLSGGTIADMTHYKFPSLSNAAKGAADDPMAAACAVLTANDKGIDAFLGATLSFADPHDKAAYRGVAERGLSEIADLLARDGVL